MGILDWAFGGERRGPRPPPASPAEERRKAAAADAALAEAVIERAIRSTDRRLAAISGVRDDLRQAALATLAHTRAMLAAFPTTQEMSERSWREGPPVRSLFARGEEIARVFSHVPGVRSCLETNGAAECFALAAFGYVERTVLAPVLEGEVLVQDRQRRTVSFSGPDVLFPQADERKLRIELGLRVVDELARRALDRLPGLPHDGPVLEMSRVAEVVHDVLASPEAHIRVEPREVALDSMNFVVDSPDRAAVRLCFHVLHIAGRDPAVVYLARFPRTELLPEADWGAAAAAL